eukprot:TRINITY_DN1017_c0_g3_i1.p1 TRINITY_DN1017_c0_g3~~TRINITY_DN1017_c0_g3_i1.p1  ORF type:complete len:293 (+),score=70.06 TRINITY_DN1017_c0_g3_i1:372-1250(+)
MNTSPILPAHVAHPAPTPCCTGSPLAGLLLLLAPPAASDSCRGGRDMAARRTQKTLVVFDFDHTVVDQNTDCEVQDLVPKQAFEGVSRKHGWTQYMADVLGVLHERGVTRAQIERRMEIMALTDGFDALLEALKARQAAHGDVEVVIASDSNTVFIDTILAKYGLTDLVSRVYTNPASWAPNGRLLLQPFTRNHGCATCSSPNMCKGQILKSHIERNAAVEYTAIHYVGDGRNDFCPLVQLRPSDRGHVRHGYALAAFLEGSEMQRRKIQAPVAVWKRGDAILRELQAAWGA